jgi:hypothetical protein
VLAIFAGLDPAARGGALDDAVARYLSRRDAALPDVPKDMTILYDHPHAWSFAKMYPNLNGFVWAGHWLQLAAQEPLELYSNRQARAEGLLKVTDRFRLKLSFGEAPNAFPTELPLAPAIAPGLVAVHPRAGAIIDNLNMMHDVLADVLVDPDVKDVDKSIEWVLDQFTSRDHRVVDEDEWIRMALRHSIFAQGGPALGTMTQSERNNLGHLQHGGVGPAFIPGVR